jgi:P pilus assembly chaperone PapD
MKKVFRSFVAIFIAFTWTSLAQAQLMMVTTRVEEEVAPSSTLTDTIALYNQSKRPMKLKAYWEDFIYKPPFSGKKEFLPVGASPYSMGQWVRFSPQEFTLQPGEKQEINYSINVPADAKGGYYGVLFFEETPPDQELQTTGVRIITRMGCLFFLESTDKQKRVILKDIGAQAYAVTGSVANQGNIFVFPKGIYYILDNEDIVVDRGELEKIYLIPDRQANFQIDLPQDIGQGTYTMVLTFDLDDGDSVVREIDFRKTGPSAIDIIEVRD